MLGIREIGEEDYRVLYYEHMRRDFPANELPPFWAVKRNLKKQIYRGIYMTDGGADVGYAVITAPDGLPYALVNFLSILPELRSKGYGSRLTETICDHWKDRVILLEVESPLAAKDEAQRELRQRRISFYERNGFRVLPTAKARIFGVDMEIMANTEKDIGSVRDVMHSLYLPAFGSRPWLKCIYIVDL